MSKYEMRMTDSHEGIDTRSASSAEGSYTAPLGGLIHNLVKSSGVYAISSLASPLVSLLLLPFLTHVLSHTDYGALAVLDTVIAFVSSITTFGVDAVFARVYSYECKTHREQLDAISTLTCLLSLIMIPITAIGVMAAPWLSILVLGNASYSSATQVAVLLVLLQNLTIPGLMWMRVESRAMSYSIISVANFLLVAAATIVLVGMLHMGVVGALIAAGLGNVIVAVCTLPLVFLRAGFHLCSPLVVSMLMLGVPYAMNYITMWVLQLSDRYLLGHLASLSVAANYAIAYSLGTGTAFVVTKPFSIAWWVLIYPIGRRVVALSTVFNSIFVVFNLGMSLQRKTWLAFIALLFSALLNVGVNIVLIPLYGAMGAAIATLAAYIALALVSYLLNQLIYPVPFEVGLFLIALVIGIALYFTDSRLTQGQSHLIVWGIHCGLLLLYGGTLAVMGCWPSFRKNGGA